MTMTEEAAPGASEKIFERIQKLLNLAEHEGTSAEEAAASRAMAERMMVKYRIEEEVIRQGKIAAGVGDSIKPIKVEFDICDRFSPYATEYRRLFLSIVDHVGNIKFKSVITHPGGTIAITALMVGFESDIRWAEMLFISLRLQFAETLEPKVDPSLSDMENVYRLRSAGMERNRICYAVWDRQSGALEKKVAALYREACEKRGEDATVVGRTVNAKKYRESFAVAYVATIGNRLWAMKSHARANGGTGEIELAGREEEVDEAFWALFPECRPREMSFEPDDEDHITGGPYGNCPKCLSAKSGYCRDHSWLRPTASKATTQSTLGLRAGRASANSADLGDGPKTTERLT
jgi:hypothetical protein